MTTKPPLKPLCSMCQHGTRQVCVKCLGCRHTCTCQPKQWANQPPTKKENRNAPRS